MTASRFLAWTGLFLFACGAPPATQAEPADPRPNDSPPSALLGTGLEEFITLADGDELIVEQGYQGGFHLTVNVRAAGFSDRDLNVTFEGRIEGGLACRGVYYSVDLAPVDGGAFAFPAGARCFVDDPAFVTMRHVQLTVNVEGEDGTRASDAREVRAGRIVRPY